MASDSRRADHVAVTSDGVTVARGVLCVEAASVGLLTLAMTFPHRFGATLFRLQLARSLQGRRMLLFVHNKELERTVSPAYHWQIFVNHQISAKLVLDYINGQQKCTLMSIFCILHISAVIVTFTYYTCVRWWTNAMGVRAIMLYSTSTRGEI